MTRYLISFDDGAMTFPEEDLPDVAEAAHAVVQDRVYDRSRHLLLSARAGNHDTATRGR